MTFWVYILRCNDGSYYTGHTDNLEKRIAEHQLGLCGGYTESRRPVAVVFTEGFMTRDEALSCEQRVKGWSRKKKEAMMRGDWSEVSRLAHEHGKSSSGGKSIHPSTASPLRSEVAQDERTLKE